MTALRQFTLLTEPVRPRAQTLPPGTKSLKTE